jgi:hypothetical protein
MSYLKRVSVTTADSGYTDPFAALPIQEIYRGLVDGRFGPRWPTEQMQRGYAGIHGPVLLRRALDFVNMLAADGAFKPGWKALDYGCGWGRFASVCLSKGSPEQLDLCDAWPHTLRLLGELGYSNRVFKVSELLLPGELSEGEYDFVLSFSVFTHLSRRAFERNIPIIVSALKPGGKFYFTVRHGEFIAHNYGSKAADLREILERDGFLFTSSEGELNSEKVFGHAVITPDYLSRLGASYFGTPHSLQHIYVVTRSG